MREIIIYEARDGEEFYDKTKCQNYETVLDKIDEIMSELRDDSNVSCSVAIRQNVETVKKVLNRFLLEVCEPAFSDSEYKKWIQEVADGTRHMSYVARLLSDNRSKGKAYYHTCFRFMCINMESGIEYEQPYYAEHEDEFEGVIE